MLRKLKDIASIATGIYEKSSPSGDTFYLQSKHFDEYGEFRGDAFLNPEIVMDGKLERHLLRDGDVLLTAKGDNNKACLYRNEIGQAVASSTFFVIRLTAQDMLPTFLQWYFNTTYMQSQFSGLSRGTHILSISKKMLMDVGVHLPPLKIQQKILDVQTLWEKERVLTLEILEQKEIFYQNLLINLAKSKSKK